MKEKDVHTKFHAKLKEWHAWVGDYDEAWQAHLKEPDFTWSLGIAETEEDAIFDLAKINGWKLWNEEEAWS
jgi:hypothetical protein